MNTRRYGIRVTLIPGIDWNYSHEIRPRINVSRNFSVVPSVVSSDLRNLSYFFRRCNERSFGPIGTRVKERKRNCFLTLDGSLNRDLANNESAYAEMLHLCIRSAQANFFEDNYVQLA